MFTNSGAMNQTTPFKNYAYSIMPIMQIQLWLIFIMNSHDVPNFDLSPTMMNSIQSRGSSIDHIVAGL